MDPSGKKMTNARAAKTPWAMMSLRRDSISPAAKSALAPGPYCEAKSSSLSSPPPNGPGPHGPGGPWPRWADTAVIAVAIKSALGLQTVVTYTPRLSRSVLVLKVMMGCATPNEGHELDGDVLCSR